MTLLASSATLSPSRTFGGVGPRPCAPPSGFGWAPPFSIVEVASGRFTTTLDHLTLRVSTATTRYVATTAQVAAASNANTGLVKTLPKRSIWHAINVGANDTIYVLGSANPATPTLYDYDHAWRLVPVQATNVIVVSDFDTLAPGYAVSSTSMAEGGAHLGAWGLGPTEAAVYEATLAATPTAVIDASSLDANGAPVELTNRASAALVQANPGSWYWSGGVLYVRTSDSRDPDANLRALRSGAAGAINGHLNTAISIYVQGMIFEGGNARAFYLQNCATATFVDCAFRNGQIAGLELNVGAGVTNATCTVYLIRCKGLANNSDGMGGTVNGSGMTLNWLEWNCEGAGNDGGVGTDQGSSLHFTAGNTAVNAIRIGGRYHGNRTHGFADVGGCDTWALGCRVYGEATGITIGDTSTAWLHGCVLTGNTTDLVTDNAAGAINTTDTIYTTSSGTGTVQRYHP